MSKQKNKSSFHFLITMLACLVAGDLCFRFKEWRDAREGERYYYNKFLQTYDCRYAASEVEAVREATMDDIERIESEMRRDGFKEWAIDKIELEAIHAALSKNNKKIEDVVFPLQTKTG